MPTDASSAVAPSSASPITPAITPVDASTTPTSRSSATTDPLHAPEPARRAPEDPAVSRRYAALPRRDTSPEMELRRALHRRGLRYRVQHAVPGLPRRRIDIAFTRHKVAVQVDGCFWHGCPEHGRAPSRNSEWWSWKIARNQARDRDTDERLTALGWRVVHVWEHEATDDAVARVLATLTPSAPR